MHHIGDPTRADLVLGRTDGNYVPPNPNASMHESLTPAWWVCEFVPKRHWDWKKQKENHRMNLFRRRTIPPASMIHQSAFDRGGDYQKRLPEDAIRVT